MACRISNWKWLLIKQHFGIGFWQYQMQYSDSRTVENRASNTLCGQHLQINKCAQTSVHTYISASQRRHKNVRLRIPNRIPNVHTPNRRLADESVCAEFVAFMHIIIVNGKQWPKITQKRWDQRLYLGECASVYICRCECGGSYMSSLNAKPSPVDHFAQFDFFVFVYFD